ncbi:Cyclic nucleotide-gated ion channel 4 [Glycine soja]
MQKYHFNANVTLKLCIVAEKKMETEAAKKSGSSGDHRSSLTVIVLVTKDDPVFLVPEDKSQKPYVAIVKVPSKPSPPSAVVDADAAGSSDTSPLQDYDGEGDDEIVLWVTISFLLKKESITLVVTVFLIMFLFQYLPKIYHSVCLLRRMQDLSDYIFGTVWWGITLNLIAYFVASHYFTDARPLEPERLKALRIQWAKYYMKLKHET